ncbi:MAG: glycerophosphodiester phosphodiesterase family protein [Litorimonas sp.]
MNAKLCSLLLAASLAACTQTEPAAAPATSGVEALSAGASGLAPIRTFLACLPDEAAVVAAHRGTGDALGAPENSVSGLEALIARGYLMAEIDLAQIVDGTLIAFHDGVWEMKASGQGPVVSTSAADFMTMRLRERENGPIGAESVPTLEQMLDASEDRIYLELDMKTSADMSRVIARVRDRGMVDQTILIASNDEEAAYLIENASDFVLSLPSRMAVDGQGIWVGGGWRDGLRDIPKDAVVLGSQWQKGGGNAAGPLDILATDQITRFDPVEGLRDRAAFEACLAEG